MIITLLLAAALQAPQPPAPSLGQQVARLTLAAPARSPQRAPDSWLSSDKFQHFWASYAATTFVYAAARAVGTNSDTGFFIAVPAALAAGVAKEVRDRRLGGPFSARDLVADGLGIAAAYFFLREVR